MLKHQRPCCEIKALFYISLNDLFWWNIGLKRAIATDGEIKAIKNLRFNVLENKVSTKVQVVKWDWTVGNFFFYFVEVFSLL